MRTLLTLAAVLALTSTADAGPLRDRLRAPRSCPSCASCPGCQSAPAYSAPPVSPDDRNISTDPRGTVATAGALVTSTGRVLLPNGDGTYRYADERPAVLPAHYAPASSCPNGRCPVPR